MIKKSWFWPYQCLKILTLFSCRGLILAYYFMISCYFLGLVFNIKVVRVLKSYIELFFALGSFMNSHNAGSFQNFSYSGDFAHSKKLLQQCLILFLKIMFRLLNQEEIVHRRWMFNSAWWHQSELLKSLCSRYIATSSFWGFHRTLWLEVIRV